MTEQDKTVKMSAIPAAAQQVFEPGEIVFGKYRVVALLGQGAMGTVYRVQHVFLKKDLALKTMESRNRSDLSVRRFEIEAKAASLLNHPNVVQVHDFGIAENGQPYLVMDLVEGVTLAEHLKVHGAMSLDEVAPVFAQACFGLMAAHEQGVVHRDIKPANIMLALGVPLGAEGSVKVLDFGIAKLMSTEEGEIQALTRTGEVFGSPLYMSPEQCTGGLIDHRCDVYSLGCVLFEALTGTPPHIGQNALSTMMLHQTEDAPTLREGALGKHFPPAVERIVSKMLSRLPGERYQNLGLVAHDLAAACKGAPITANQPVQAIFGKSNKVVSMNAGHLVLLAAVLILTTGTVTFLTFYLSGQDRVLRGAENPSQGSGQVGRESGTIEKSTTDDDSRFLEFPEKTEFNQSLVLDAQAVVTATGAGKKRELVFPDQAIGKIWSAHIEREAKGIVRVPYNCLVRLSINLSRLDPAALKKLDGTTISWLSLDGSSTPDAAEKVSKILKIATAWPSLQTVSLASLKADHAVLEALNNLPGLRGLTLSQIETNSDALCRQPFLERVRTLIVINFEADSLVSRMGASSNLHFLALDNAHASAESLLKLSGCQNLSRLVLVKEGGFDDSIVRATSQLGGLTNLSLLGCNLSDKQIGILVKCPWLQVIGLSKEEYGGDHMDALKSLDKRIHFQKPIDWEAP
jgi:serine/threonine protein kinase